MQFIILIIVLILIIITNIKIVPQSKTFVIEQDYILKFHL